MKKFATKAMAALLAAMLATMLLIAAGCADVQSKQARIRVAVGIVPVAAFVAQVAGDRADVITMIPPGYSPANYEPTAGQMRALSDADVYFTLHMPAETSSILPRIADFNEDVRMIDLHEAVEQIHPMIELNGSDGEHADHDHGEADDPHIWLSPKRAVVMVHKIADTLAQIDPEGAAVYQSNAADYIAQIKALDKQIELKLAGLENRSFLIYHPSYTYFAEDYGLQMLTIEAAGKTAGAAEMVRVIGIAQQSGITTVFYQGEFSSSRAQAVAEQIGGVVREARPLAQDYIIALGEFAAAIAGETK